MDARTDLVDRLEDLTPHERRNVVAALQELYGTCTDARAGYEEAAHDVRDPPVAELLAGYALEETRAAEALASLLREFGVEPYAGRHLGAEVHRRLIALRAAIGHGDPAAILPECERGERWAVLRYERALATPMPIHVADALLDLATAARERRAAFERMRHPW